MWAFISFPSVSDVISQLLKNQLRVWWCEWWCTLVLTGGFLSVLRAALRHSWADRTRGWCPWSTLHTDGLKAPKLTHKQVNTSRTEVYNHQMWTCVFAAMAVLSVGPAVLQRSNGLNSNQSWGKSIVQELNWQQLTTHSCFATIPLPSPSSSLHKRKINASIPLHLHQLFCVLVPLADTVYLLNLALWPHCGTSMP